MNKKKIFIACDTAEPKKIKQIINQSNNGQTESQQDS